jgi:ADP-ribosylglycohydrolase
VVLELTPPGLVRRGVAEALELTGQRDASYAGHRLGNGRLTSAVDTVPFTLWCAAVHPDGFEAALRACVEAGGDVDTTGAIVGGILGARLGAGAVPGRWTVEALPKWFGA